MDKIFQRGQVLHAIELNEMVSAITSNETAIGEVASSLNDKASTADVESALVGKADASDVAEIDASISDLDTIRRNGEDLSVAIRKEFVLIGGRRYEKRINTSGVCSTENQYYFVAFPNDGVRHRWKLHIEGTLSNSNYYLTISHGDSIPNDGDTVEVLHSRKYDGKSVDDVIIESDKQYVFLCIRELSASYITGITFKKECDNIIALSSDYKPYKLMLATLGRGAIKGYLDPEGNHVSFNGDYRYSILLDVRGLDFIQYWERCTASANYPNASCLWYDADNNVIGTLTTMFKTSSSYSQVRIAKVPANAAYLRMSFHKNTEFFTVYSKCAYASFLEKVKTFKRLTGDNPNHENQYELGILHLSDIHGDEDAKKSIESFKALMRIFAPNTMPLHTGDMVHYWADEDNASINASDWWKATGLANYCYSTLGNHDVTSKTADPYEPGIDAKGRDWCWETYYAPFITRVGYEMPTGYDDPSSPNYKAMFWKKDYPYQKIRVIGLDCIHRFDGILDPATGEIQTAGYRYTTNEQELWLISTLNETLDRNNAAYGYSVIVCGHYPLDDVDEINNTTNTSENGGFVYSELTGKSVNFNASDNEYVANSSYHYRNRVDGGSQKGDVNNIGDIIETWRANGGKFVVYLCGHTHKDMMFYPKKYPNLLNLCVNRAGYSSYDNNKAYKMTRRPDFEDYISVNYIGISPDDGRLFVVKAGYVAGVISNRMECLNYDYINRKVIFEA